MNFSQELELFRSHGLCVLPEWSLCVHTQWEMAIKLWTHRPSWLTCQCGGHSLSKNAFFIYPPWLLSVLPTEYLDPIWGLFLPIFSREENWFHFVSQSLNVKQTNSSYEDGLWITECQRAMTEVLQSMNFILFQWKGSLTPGSCSEPELLSLSHFIARQCKSALVVDQRPREQLTESSDPCWLWDQVHNVRDHYT